MRVKALTNNMNKALSSALNKEQPMQLQFHQDKNQIGYWPTKMMKLKRGNIFG
jgi:hypothetical protein